MKKETKDKPDMASKRVDINLELCKGCGICVAFCPKKALVLNDHEKAVLADPDLCEHCGLCELRCPDMAIEVTK